MKKSKIISGLLVLLGFSGCEFNNGETEIPEFPLMYGPGPVSGFTVKGLVTDADENPIEGIRVVIRPTIEGSLPGFVNDTLLTDKNGKYWSHVIDITVPSLTAAAADIDGPANGGEFLPAESAITNEDFAGRDSKGYFAVKSFVLEKKVESEDEEQ